MNAPPPAPPANSSEVHIDRTEEALHLTVHSMPNQAALATPKSQFSARLKLLLLFAVCCAPVVASYLTYYFFRPDARRNFGELIEPQQPIPALLVKNQQGAEVPLASLRGQWLLISVNQGPCDKVCQDNLYYQRQLRELMGKDKDRIDKVTLLLDDTPLEPNLLPALKDVTVLRADQKAIAAWLKPQAEQSLRNHIYIVDPLGNWMMRFPPITKIEVASKAKRDLERLMRASSFWDTAGRQ